MSTSCASFCATQLLIASGSVLICLVTACSSRTPLQRADNGTNSTQPQRSTPPKEVASDEERPTGVHLSALRPTDARFCVGWGFGCGITLDGHVRCWGSHRNGELGIGMSGQTSSPDAVGVTNATRIACGEINSTGGNACALTKDGSLWCWGSVFTGTTPEIKPEPVKVLDHIVDIKTGADRACALSEDGTLRCWGANHRGQLGNGTRESSAIPIRLPGLGPVYDFSIQGFGGCAIGTDGEVRCWGDGPCRPATGSVFTPRVVPGLRGARWVSSRDPLFVIDAKGSLVSYQCIDTKQGLELTEVARLDKVTRAYDSIDRLCAVRTDERVYCIEREGLGDRVFGFPVSTTGFAEVEEVRGSKELALTRFHACASFDDRVRCFGDQHRGGFFGSTIPQESWLTVREPARPVPVHPATPPSDLVVAAEAPAPPVAAVDFVCPTQLKTRPSYVTTTRRFSDISPADHRTCINGRVTGLLVTSSFTVPHLSWAGVASRAPGQPVTGGNYLFAHNHDGFNAIYFDTPVGINSLHMQGTRGDGGGVYRKFASMLDPQQPNPWKLNRAAHIVRLRVNEGFGSLNNIIFIASDVEILDGSPEIPLDPTAVLSGFLSPLATETSPEGKRWRDLLLAATSKKMTRDASFKKFAADTPDRQILSGFHATWDEQTEQLRVGFYASLTETRAHQAPNPDPAAGSIGCRTVHPKADCARMPIPRTITVSLVHRSEYAIRAIFSKTGALVKREELPVDTQ